MPEERKLVTILFCDLVASTERRARLGDDRFDEFSERFLRTLRDAIAAHQGREVSSAGDGPVTPGFRAEDAAVVPGGGQIGAPIYSLELLGEASMVSMRVGGELVSIKTGKDFAAEIGAPISATVPARACHLFDLKSGKRLGGVAA